MWYIFQYFDSPENTAAAAPNKFMISSPSIDIVVTSRPLISLE